MKIDKTLIISSAVCLLPILLGILLYEKLPDQIPIHFDFAGEPDNWGPKNFVVFGIPVFMCLMNIFVQGVSDKYGDNNQSIMLKFCKWIFAIISVIILPVVLFKALGMDIPIQIIVSVFVGVMFMIIGNYFPKTKQNRVAGVRIKWTMDSEENWNKTSRFAGYLWIVGGLLIIIDAFLAYQLAIMFFGIIIILVAAPVLYSYHLHRKGI